jgi:hypothetical protein
MVVVDYQIALSSWSGGHRRPRLRSSGPIQVSGLSPVDPGVVDPRACGLDQPAAASADWSVQQPGTVSGWAHGRAKVPGCCLGRSMEFL